MKPPYILVFLASFLLFFIQPLAGKQALFLLGGVSSIWTTTLFFFMSILFIAYLYANFLSKQALQKQKKYHFFLVSASIINVLLINLDSFHDLGNPAATITLNLLANLGLPLLVLGSNSTLVQHWLSQISTKNPYRLYTVSNAGSLIGLLSFPLLLEVNLSTNQQLLTWKILYLLTTGLVLKLIKQLPKRSEAETIVTQKPKLRTFLGWTGLSMSTNLLMLTTTTHITQEITPIPLIWVVILAAFLISYIIPFSQKNDSPTFHQTIYGLIAINVLFITKDFYLGKNFLTPIFLEVGVFFVVALTIHTTLYNIKPAVKELANYYLAIALGGVIASMTAVFVAPYIFTEIWEYPISYVVVVMTLFVTISKYLNNFTKITFITLGCISAIFLITLNYADSVSNLKNLMVYSRNFYGILKINSTTDPNGNAIKLLYNGTTLHGSQLQDEKLKTKPTTYYAEDTGVGIRLKGTNKYTQGEPMKVGVIGLGVGTMATYCRPGDHYIFYEINPKVVSYAQTYFSYIKDCQKRGGTVDIVVGDARQSLENGMRETGSEKFDYLVVDAFTDDAIPVHLLTHEAVKLYFEHLDSAGIIAIHVSNRYFDLSPIVQAFTTIIPSKFSEINQNGAGWTFLELDNTIKNSKDIRGYQKPWTDSLNSLFSAIKK